jgi:hypothetical protein
MNGQEPHAKARRRKEEMRETKTIACRRGFEKALCAFASLREPLRLSPNNDVAVFIDGLVSILLIAQANGVCTSCDKSIA